MTPDTCDVCGAPLDAQGVCTKWEATCPQCHGEDLSCTLCEGVGRCSPNQAQEWRDQNPNDD